MVFDAWEDDFPFPGEIFLRFQPFSFRGDTRHAKLPFLSSLQRGERVSLHKVALAIWKFHKTLTNIVKHPKNYDQVERKKKERLNYPGPMIFKYTFIYQRKFSGKLPIYELLGSLTGK